MNIIDELNKLRDWNSDICSKKENQYVFMLNVEKSLYPENKKTTLHEVEISLSYKGPT